MKVSRPGVPGLLYSPLWVPLVMPCCVTTSSKTDPGVSSRPNSNALSDRLGVELPRAAGRTVGTGSRRKEAMSSEGRTSPGLKAFTNYYPQVTIKDGRRSRTLRITIAPFDPAQAVGPAGPALVGLLFDAGGTVTIVSRAGCNQPAGARNRATPNGAQYRPSCQF